MRGRTGLAPLLGLLLLWSLVGDMPTLAQAPTTSVFFTLEQGAFTATLLPLRKAQDVASFYNYTNFQSNMAEGLEVIGRSLLFVYQDTVTGSLSLVVVHSRAGGGAGGAVLTFSGVPQGVQFQVQDDPDDTYSLTPPTGQVTSNWQDGFNDGFALGPLSQTFEITITPQFNFGITDWVALSGGLPNPETILLPSLSQPVVLRAQVGTPPTAEFTFTPEAPGVGVPITFDARASRAAPGRRIVRYEWDFNADGIFEVSSSSATVQHTFDRIGEARVTLKVVDDQGVSATATRIVRVVEVSARTVRSISTPEAAVGFTFRITVEVQVGISVNGLGLDEDLPPGFEVTPVDSAGATFKRAETQWIWAETIRANEIRRIVYDVTIRPAAVIGPLPRCFEIKGFLESASPAFLMPVGGESSICMVDCLSLPVAISHLTPQDVVDLRLDEFITADQLQRAVAFWLEEAGVPATCNALLTWEMLKGLVARHLAGIPVDQPIPENFTEGARVTRTILTPLPFAQVYLPGNHAGRVFRVRMEIAVTTDLMGFGLKEIFPVRWEIRPIENSGAVFKRATREWVFTERLTRTFDKAIIYEVIVPEGESTGMIRFQGKSQGILPRFETPIGGDTEVELIECLTVPVAVAHLDTRQNTIDVTLSNLIKFDQIQAAIAFWLEDVNVPGTCGLAIDFEAMKILIAHWLTDTPVDQPLPGGVSLPPRR
jgi:PKD repeat protein